MSNFKVHTLDSAPIQSKPILEKIMQSLGFIPNYLGILAASPAALENYMSTLTMFSKSTLSSEEQQLVLFMINNKNASNYYMLRYISNKNISRLSKNVIRSIKEGEQITDARLHSLYTFIKLVMWKHGYISPYEIENFLSVGFTHENILEILMALNLNTLINYVRHITNLPIENKFEEVFSKYDNCISF